jgi:hypothetical protein
LERSRRDAPYQHANVYDRAKLELGGPGLIIAVFGAGVHFL